MNEMDGLVDATHMDVVKGGETCISLGLERSSKGLKVSIKAHPRVEDFFKTLSAGNLKDAKLCGRTWRLLDPASPMMSYELGQKIGGFSHGEGEFTIDKLGSPIICSGSDSGAEAPATTRRPGDPFANNYGSSGGPKVNISFLRLQGISEGNGISFYVGGVYSKDEVDKLLEVLGTGLRRFYIDFIRPMNVSVQISTQSV